MDKMFKELRKAGYETFGRYQDPRKGGWRIKLVLGRRDPNITSSIPRGYADMKQETPKVLEIIRTHHPDVELSCWIGVSYWLAEFIYFKKKES